MAKKFSDLRAAMSPAARRQADSQAKAMLSEMPRHELRQARDQLSPNVVAEFKVTGPAWQGRINNAQKD